MMRYPSVTVTARVRMLLGTPALMKCLTVRYLLPVASSFIMAAVERKEKEKKNTNQYGIPVEGNGKVSEIITYSYWGIHLWVSP